MRKRIGNLVGVFAVCLAVVGCGDNELAELSHPIDSMSDETFSLLYEQNQELFRVSDMQGAHRVTDSLMQYAYSTGDVVMIIDANLELAYFHLLTNQNESGLEKLAALRDTVHQYGSDNQIMAWATRKGHFLNQIGRYGDGLQIIETYLQRDDLNYSQLIMGAALTMKGAALGNLHRYDQALVAYQQALQIAKEHGRDYRSVAILHNNIATILENVDRYEDSLEELEKAYKLNIEANDVMGIAMNLNNIANALSGMGYIDASIDTLKSVIKITEETRNFPSLIRNYYNISLALYEADRLAEGYGYANRGYQMSHEIGFPPGIMYLATSLARFHYLQDNWSEVINYGTQALELAESMENLQVNTQVLELLVEAQREMGNLTNALDLQKRYSVLNDSLRSVTSAREIERVRSQFSFDILSAENELLKQELAFTTERNRNQVIFLLFLFIGMCAFGGFLYVVYRQKTLIQKQNEHLKALNEQQDALVNMIVHDLRSPLSSLISSIDILKTDLAIDDPDLKEIVDIASLSGEKLRLMINGLLDVKGLERHDHIENLETVPVAQITEEVISYYDPIAEKKGISFQCDIQKFEVHTHPEFYGRILDNLLSNAIKYSESDTTVRVTITPPENNKWVLKVRDEGPGFSESDKKEAFQLFARLSARPTANEPSSGIGLYIIKLLTEKLGGTVELESDQGKGTVFTCTFPILKSAK